MPPSPPTLSHWINTGAAGTAKDPCEAPEGEGRARGAPFDRDWLYFGVSLAIGAGAGRKLWSRATILPSNNTSLRGG
jgi:hypothetical protein